MKTVVARTLPRAIGITILASLCVVLVACGPEPQSTFDTAGPVAELQRNLLLFVFIIAAVVFVIVEGLIVFIALRYRRRRNDSTIPKQTHGNPKLEIVWTLIPIIIIIAIAIPTVQGIWQLARTPDGALEVQAVGHRWWFEFRYPTKEIVTSNELRVPTNTPVSVDLGSQDVIHSFWVPRLFGKTDMIPGRDTNLWFEASEPGIYEGQCAEFCGEAHAQMKFRVIAMPPDEFEAWADDWFTPPDPTITVMPGAALFATNCSTCHTVNSYRLGGYQSELDQQDSRWNALTTACADEGLTPACGSGVGIVSAPNLTHFGQRTTVGAAWRPLNEQTLSDWIKDPSSIKIGTYMQAFARVYDTPDGTADLSDEDVAQIVDYLLALTPQQAETTAGAPQDDN